MGQAELERRWWVYAYLSACEHVFTLQRYGASLLCAGECLMLLKQLKYKEMKAHTQGLCCSQCLASVPPGLPKASIRKLRSGDSWHPPPSCPQDSALHHQRLGFLLGCSDGASPLPNHLRTLRELERRFGSGVKTFSGRKSLFIYLLTPFSSFSLSWFRLSCCGLFSPKFRGKKA